MKIKNGKFWLGDCLELMKDITDGSVDMILCDLPYGTTACKWDTVIPFEPLWEQYWRVAKPNAAIVLTASQPFTTALISSQINNFKYEWIWVKNKVTGFMQAKLRPMKKQENVCVFGKFKQSAQHFDGIYNPQGVVEIGSVEYNNDRNSNHITGNRVKGKTLKSGKGYPSDVLNFDLDGDSRHPTQKPVALFEYLIKTYTNEGETVLDNCAGSGTTAVACEQTNRKWICIEKEPEYYYPAVMRVAGS